LPFLAKLKNLWRLAVLQISLNLGQNLSTDERILAMNLSPVYEKWRQETLDEGLQQGLEQGLQRGRQEEGRSLILRLLTRRIGTIAPTSEAKILTLSISELETLGEALLDFSSSADLDDWLRTIGA
jgi:predicted transposase YdaD